MSLAAGQAWLSGRVEVVEVEIGIVVVPVTEAVASVLVASELKNIAKLVLMLFFFELCASVPQGIKVNLHIVIVFVVLVVFGALI